MAIPENRRYLRNFAPQTPLETQSGSPAAYGAPILNSSNQLREARDAVQLEFGQRERGLQTSAQDAISQFNRLSDEERSYGEAVDPRIENIYGALQASLGQNVGENRATYGNAIGQIRDWYDQAFGANNRLNQEAISRITADAERLGTGAALPVGTARMTEDFLYNQGQNRNSQADRSANMAELAAKIEALDRNRVGAAGREGAQQRASIANEVARTTGDLSLNHQNEMRGIRTQQAGLTADRGVAERNALDQLRQRDFANLQTARRNSLEEFLGRAGLGLQQSEFLRGNYDSDRNFNLAREELGISRDELRLNRELGLGDLDVRRQQTAADIEQSRADTQIRRQQLQQEMILAERELAAANTPEARQRAQLELARLRLENNALARDIVAPRDQAPKVYPPGEIGFTKYVQDNKFNRTLVSAVRGLISDARTNGGDNAPDYALSKVDTMIRNGFASDADAQKIRNMLNVYYLGFGV